MKITVGVKKGIEKNQCDDTAVVGCNVINDDYYEYEGAIPIIVGVADGVGGNAGGKEASTFVANKLKDMEGIPDREHFKEAVLRINNELMEYAAHIPGKERMATTMTVLAMLEHGYAIAHIGNTRLYIAQGNYLKQFTKDHTTYQMLIDRGDATEAEACNPDEIYACLGGGNSNLISPLMVMDFNNGELPNVLILTSDGIHEFIDIDSLEDLVFSRKSDREIVEKAISEALEKGSKDDMTMIIVRK